MISSSLGQCRDTLGLCSKDTVITNTKMFEKDVRKHPELHDPNSDHMAAGTVYIYQLRTTFRRTIPANYFCEFTIDLRRDRDYEF